MKMKAAMDLYATAAGGQTEGSNLINTPGNPDDTPAVRDKARQRLVKTNPDIDAKMETNETPQTDSAAFIGKKYIVQDIKYGHFISEHDDSASASRAEEARPYSRILRNDVPSDTKRSREAAAKKRATVNPDVQ